MLAADSSLVDVFGDIEMAVSGVPQAVFPRIGRTHAWAPCNLPRTIHRLDNANSVVSCAVFFFNPR